MKYFDAHAHYLSGRFNKDRHELLRRMHKNGVEYIVNSTNSDELARGLQLAKQYDFFYLNITDDYYYKTELDIGVDKNRVLIDQLFSETVVKLKKLCAENKKIVGYGECWMDFRRTEKTPAEVRKQSFWLQKDFEMARAIGLPVIIHSGNADQESFDVIKKMDMPDYGGGKGMMHSYLGPPQMALDYIDMGYLISVTGLVTHSSPRGKNLADVVKVVPLQHMVIETDAPYLTPEPFRDKRNDSGLLRLTVEKIAKIKNVLPEEVVKATTANAKALFRIE
jgi:TatD DNase family protein